LVNCPKIVLLNRPSGQFAPNSGTIIIRYLPFIAKDIVEKSTIEEL